MHEGIRTKVNPPVFHEGSNGGKAQQMAADNALLQSKPNVDLPKRPERKPFGSMQLKLAHEIRPGFHGHWFSDTPGRVQRAQEAGYEHVKDKDGKPISRVVGTAEGGGAQVGFLMEIPEEWYKADMKIEQAQIDEKEEMIRRGKLDKPENGYVGAQGISIRHGN